MPFRKGQSGNPRGKKPGTKAYISKELENILQANGGQKAREIAETLVTLTLKGDMQAGKLVLDRLEGRTATAEELAKRAGATEATKMAPDQRRKKLIDLLRQPEFRDLVAEAVLPTSESVQ